jgi:GNAT superfamily N-acetyltransferase
LDGLTLRRATPGDLVTLVAMLSDDALGRQRETLSDPLPASYAAALAAIDADPNNELMVGCLGEEVVGMMQLTFIPYLTYRGGWRCLIEGVRIGARHRGEGLGNQMFRWAIERARERGCHLVQLTSDKQRPDALRFYEALGFQATHEGMKLHL